MNIFVTDIDPKKSASFLDIKRKNKMLIESVQMLSTTVNLLGGVGPYKSTHANHPCRIWVSKSYENFKWLYDHADKMGDDYFKRTGKVHKSHKIMLESNILQEGMTSLPRVGLTDFVNCTDHFKNKSDIFLAYRLELGWKWGNDKHIPQFDKF